MLINQVIISFLSVIIIGSAGLISVPILSRLLEPEKLGKIFVILGIVSIMQIFDALKPVIINRLNDNKFCDAVYLRSFNKINWVFIAIGSGLIFTALMFVKNISFWEITIFVITFVLLSLMSVQWALLEARMHLNYTAISRTIGWVVTYIVFIGFAYTKIDDQWYILPVALMYLVLFVLFKLKTYTLFQKKDLLNTSAIKIKALEREMFWQTITIIKIQIYSIILLAMDKLIVPAITGYANFAYYAVQSELATKSYLINTSVRRVLLPYLAKEATEAKLFKVNKVALLLFAISTFLMLLLSNYAETIIGLYAGDAYKQYYLILSTLLFVFPANILGAAGVLTLSVKGDFDLHHGIYRNIAILFLFPFALFTYLYGIYGAAAILLLTRSVDLYTYCLSYSKYLAAISKVSMHLLVIFYCGIGIAVLLERPEIGLLLLLFLCVLLYKLYQKINIK